MSEPLQFTSLGDDILHLIVTQLENDAPSSLSPLARASKFCKRLIDPSIYSFIELKGNDKAGKLESTDHFVRRMLDTEDDICWHVKHLKITNFHFKAIQGDTVQIFNSEKLEQILGNLKQLKSFSWNSISWIPENVITKLEKCWPDVKLRVTNNRRIRAVHSELNMDLRLLSSPLLYGLDYSVFHVGFDMAYSEFPKLKEILLKSNRLRVLHLKMSSTGVPANQNGNRDGIDIPLGENDRGPLNLHLRRGDRLPPLQQLSICDWIPYDLSAQHCEIWRDCMDWGRLLRLDLGAGCPGHFFQQLSGSVSNLKWLRMGFKTGAQNHGTTTCEDAGQVENFLGTIDGLEELFIANYEENPSILLAAIMKQRRTLRTLSFHSPPDRRYRRETALAWSTLEMETLLERCKQLSRLEVDIGLEGGHHWPSPLVPSLTGTNQLRAVKLYLEIPIKGSNFSGEYKYDGLLGQERPPPLNEGLARSVATDLFVQFFRKDPCAYLRELEICFTRLDIYDRMQSEIVEDPMRVRRLERDDAKRPEDGGFSVEYQKGWRLRDL